MRMMISSSRRFIEHPKLNARCSPKLGCKHHDRIFEHPSTLHVFQQSGDRFVDTLTRSRMILLQLTVRIPLTIITEIHQRITYTAFGQSTSCQTSLTVDCRRRVVDSVKLLSFLSLFRQVQGLRHRLLHAKRKFIGIDASLQLRILRKLLGSHAIQLLEKLKLSTLLNGTYISRSFAERKWIRRIQMQLNSTVGRAQIMRIKILFHSRIFELAQKHKLRQILIQRPQPIVEP